MTHFGEEKMVKKHLFSLKKRLLKWAEWMKPYSDQGLSPEQVTPQFQAFVKKEMARFNIVGEEYDRYETANPAWMSVAGLMRYWHKRIRN